MFIAKRMRPACSTVGQFNPFLVQVSSVEGILELEKETFDKFWELSAPGSEAEECFLRVPQTEYFYNDGSLIKVLKGMPDVSSS